MAKNKKMAGRRRKTRSRWRKKNAVGRKRRGRSTYRVGRAISKLQRAVKRVRRQLNPPSVTKYDDWDPEVLECSENSINYTTKYVGGEDDIDGAKGRMYRDSDGSGATAHDTTGVWGRGAWCRLNQLQVTTIRNNYATPACVHILPFKRQRVKTSLAGMTADALPLYLLEQGYNDLTMNVGTNIFGGLATTAATGSCDVQSEVTKVLNTKSWRKTSPYYFGQYRKIWLQPGQSLTLGKKAITFRKYTSQDELYGFNAQGYLIGVSGSLAHDTTNPSTSVGYAEAKIDMMTKVYNTLVYQVAHNRFEDYFPDESTLGTTLEVTLPRDPAIETTVE